MVSSSTQFQPLILEVIPHGLSSPVICDPPWSRFALSRRLTTASCLSISLSLAAHLQPSFSSRGPVGSQHCPSPSPLSFLLFSRNSVVSHNHSLCTFLAPLPLFYFFVLFWLNHNLVKSNIPPFLRLTYAAEPSWKRHRLAGASHFTFPSVNPWSSGTSPALSLPLFRVTVSHCPFWRPSAPLPHSLL